MASQQQSAGRIGRVAEHIVAAWILRNHDAWVSIMPDAASVDLLVQVRANPMRVLRVQVKAVYTTAAGFRTVNLTKSDGSRYTESDIDFIVACDPDTLTNWVFPVSFARRFGRLRLRKLWSGYAYGWSEESPMFGGWTIRS